MRPRAGTALALAAHFLACSGETERGGRDRESAAGGPSGAGGSAGAAGRSATAGSSDTGGSSAGSSGVSSASGAASTSNSGGVAGVAGGPQQQGGVAGRTEIAGASGTAAAGGTANAAGSSGEGGMGGEAGATNQAGTAGRDAAGAGGTSGAPNDPVGLSWPIDCTPGQTCLRVGYPDIDDDGVAHDCGEPGYVGHQGTDIDISPEAQAAGTAVRAAAAGVVVFAFDGKYDQCPDANEPDCQAPTGGDVPGSSTGTTVCTPIGPYCGTGEPGCFWCFQGGNVIVIRHEGVPGVFATRYDHLKRNSVLVRPGDSVTRGQKIAEAGSSGNSTTSHLHFEVWGTGFYELADPWAGECGPNLGPSLWAYEPPWSAATTP